MSIVNLRGTSGSGKTWAVRQLMALYQAHGMSWSYVPGTKERGVRAGYHEGIAPWRTRPLRILGYYDGATCGGCDGIRTQLDAEQLLREAVSANADCVFEGLLISHLRSRWARLPFELGVPWRFIFLDTTLETCLQRATDRRVARGNLNPLNPKNTSDKYRDIMKRLEEFHALGLDCCMVSSADAAKEMYAYLDPGRECPTVRPVCAPAREPAPAESSGSAPVDDGPDTLSLPFHEHPEA